MDRAGAFKLVDGKTDVIKQIDGVLMVKPYKETLVDDIQRLQHAAADCCRQSDNSLPSALSLSQPN